MLFFAPQFTYYGPLDLAQLYVEITERKGIKYINKKTQHSFTQILTLLPAWQKAAKAFTGRIKVYQK